MSDYKSIRIKDIAEKAGVSVGTVDRVLHNRKEVSKATKEKVLKIVEEMEYQPNMIARSLASKKKTSFSVLLPSADEGNEFWLNHIKGVEKAISELAQFQVTVDIYYFNLYDREKFIEQYTRILENPPSGVALAPIFFKEAIVFCEKLDKINVPYVLFDSNLSQCNALSYTGENAIVSGRVAGQLIDFGLDVTKEILVVNFTKNLKNSAHLESRHQGLCEYFEENNQNRVIHSIDIGIPTFNEVQKQLNAVFRQNKHIGALFVTGSKVHLLAQYIKVNGLNQRIIGYDLIDKNVEYLQNNVIQFLLSHRPVEQGYRSIKKLFDHALAGQATSKNEYLPVDIVNKENVASLID